MSNRIALDIYLRNTFKFDVSKIIYNVPNNAILINNWISGNCIAKKYIKDKTIYHRLIYKGIVIRNAIAKPI